MFYFYFWANTVLIKNFILLIKNYIKKKNFQININLILLIFFIDKYNFLVYLKFSIHDNEQKTSSY